MSAFMHKRLGQVNRGGGGPDGYDQPAGGPAGCKGRIDAREMRVAHVDVPGRTTPPPLCRPPSSFSAWTSSASFFPRRKWKFFPLGWIPRWPATGWPSRSRPARLTALRGRFFPAGKHPRREKEEERGFLSSFEKNPTLNCHFCLCETTATPATTTPALPLRAGIASSSLARSLRLKFMETDRVFRVEDLSVDADAGEEEEEEEEGAGRAFNHGCRSALNCNLSEKRR